MAPKKRVTRASPATTTTTTTPVTNVQFKVLINQGIADALATRDADRSRNGEDNHDSGTGVRRQYPLTREYTYPDFIKCKPLYFKGAKGVVETVGHDVAYAMTWTNLKKKMIDKYCPRGGIKKLEKMAAKKRATRASPATTTTTTTPVTNVQFKVLINQGIADALAARDADRSRNGEDNHDSGTGVRRQYPLTRECTYPDFIKCKPLYFKDAKGVVEELALMCAKMFPEESDKIERSPTTTNNLRNLTCYECGNQRHYRSDFLKLKNKNHGNQAGGTGARGMAHALGGGETNQDLNNMEDDINS
nr:hypothetical protein [Tanacetum cinerariifolium]